MSNYNFIIGEFGLQNIKPKLYKAGEPLSPSDSFDDLAPIPAQEVLDLPKSYFGTPVFSRLTLADPESDLALDIDTALLQVSQSKNIVTTAINGRNGTIKEYVSDGDYQISIKGVLVESVNTNLPPTEDFQTLIELCKLPRALDCVCAYLGLFGIYKLVVQEQSFPQSEGFQNMQPFELSCLSDKPIELLLDA